MTEIDPITGLPKELGLWENITKESQEIKVYTIKKKFGTENTVVEGLGKDIDLKDTAKKLKNILACGGTAKESKIELQGGHIQKVKEELIKMGFPAETITVK